MHTDHFCEVLAAFAARFTDLETAITVLQKEPKDTPVYRTLAERVVELADADASTRIPGCTDLKEAARMAQLLPIEAASAGAAWLECQCSLWHLALASVEKESDIERIDELIRYAPIAAPPLHTEADDARLKRARFRILLPEEFALAAKCIDYKQAHRRWREKDSGIARELWEFRTAELATAYADEMIPLCSSDIDAFREFAESPKGPAKLRWKMRAEELAKRKLCDMANSEHDLAKVRDRALRAPGDDERDAYMARWTRLSNQLATKLAICRPCLSIEVARKYLELSEPLSFGRKAWAHVYSALRCAQ